MFSKKIKHSDLDKEIDSLFKKLSTLDKTSKEYSAVSANLEVLMKLKGGVEPKRGISPDTLVLVAGNLVGILLVLYFEQASAVTSKAFGMVGKWRA